MTILDALHDLLLELNFFYYEQNRYYMRGEGGWVELDARTTGVYAYISYRFQHQELSFADDSPARDAQRLTTILREFDYAPALAYHRLRLLTALIENDVS